MCRHPPGPRCYAHSHTSLVAAQRDRDAAVDRVEQAASLRRSDEVVTKALDNAERAQRRVDTAQRRLDATGTGRRELDTALADTDHPGRDVLVYRRAVAGALVDARRGQVAAMPPAPDRTITAAAAAYDRLGHIREDIAHIDAMLATPRPPGGEHVGLVDTDDVLTERRDRLRRDALIADAECRMASAAGAAAAAHLSPREMTALGRVDAGLARQIVFQSHVRAAADTGAHRDMGEVIEASRSAVAGELDWVYPPIPGAR